MNQPFRAVAVTAFLALFLFFPAARAPAVGQPSVPAFSEVTGHRLGERETLHAEMVRYLERLAEASPRITLLDQGTSWEGRRLLAAVVTAPENHARLDEIRARAARLGDPRGTTPEEARRLAEGQPVVVWLGGSIHGNELSGGEGLLKLLDHLARRDDPATLEVLRKVVVVVDPILNPDGRDAFAAWNRRTRGRVPNPDPADWGNDATSWEGLGYRTGHYNFDTNRDWFAHTQRETRGRVPTLLAWRPQVAVDAHEMGRDVEFYFDPPTEPYGPFFPEFAREWFGRFGEAYAAAFDSAGVEYMTRERYNYFYPGYTTSYTSYQGAVGMLYEQGTSRGPALERPDGSVRSLAEALDHQYLAAWTALRTAADRREELLAEYDRAHRRHVGEGTEGVRRYLLPPGDDPGLRRELADLLLRNGIEVGRLTSPVRLDGLQDRAGRPAGARTFPEGTLVVEAAQPRNRLLRALLEPHQPISEAFLREARARLERDENPRFYDITAWSLPLLFDLEAYGTRGAESPAAEPLTGPPGEQPAFPPGPPRYAYLLDGRQAASVAALYHLRHAGHRIGVLLRPSRVEGRDLPGGTVIVRVAENGEGLHEAVREVASRYGLDVRGVDTGLSEPGFPALGSGDVVAVRAPRIALVAEGPVHGYSFGWAWYTLEEQHQVPVTVLRAGSLRERALERYDVLVLPHLSSVEGLAEALGEDGRARLARWVRDGGTLVAVGAATDFVRERLELVGLRSWYDVEEGKDAYRFDVPGAILQAEVDTLAWLSAGYRRAELPVLVTSSRVLLPPEGPPDSRKRAVVRYTPAAPLRLSGHLWPESEERLPGAVFLYEERVGAGRVIAFSEDPNFRAYWRGANRLFLNAVVLGPSAP